MRKTEFLATAVIEDLNRGAIDAGRGLYLWLQDRCLDHQPADDPAKLSAACQWWKRTGPWLAW